MIPYGSDKRFYIGGCVLAAILLVGYNAFTIATLFSPPLVSRSEGTRLASQKWMRLGNKLSLIADETPKDINLETVAASFKEKMNTVEEAFAHPQLQKAAAIAEEPAEGVKAEPTPPTLGGILLISGGQIEDRFFVLIEDKLLKENESINGYLIKKIRPEGVELIYGDRALFVPAPDVLFSSDTEN